MQSVAFYATLDNTTGIALRAADGPVHFQMEATGVWIELCDRDIPRLMLNGRCDLVFAADVADGDRVRRCSRTLQEVAA